MPFRREFLRMKPMPVSYTHLVSILLMLAAAVVAYLFSRSEKDGEEIAGDVPEGAEE